MLYTPLAWIARRAIRWCYRDVAVAGDIPRHGPVLLAVNHPNDLVDVCTVLGLAPRRVTFVANVTASEQPLVSFAYRKLGVIPVHRIRDARKARSRGEDSVRANADAFARVRDVLSLGGCVCVFPEGGVNAGPDPGPLRSGLARMALEASAIAGVRGIQIVPVGLTYDAPYELRSRLRMEAGEPIDVDTWRPDESRTPESQLTAEIASRLRAVTGRRFDIASQRTLVGESEAVPALLSAAGAPFALLGLVFHAPAWKLLRLFARRKAQSHAELIPRSIVPGLYIMLLWYVAAFLALWLGYSSMRMHPAAAMGASFVTIALLPTLGDIGLRWRDGLLDRRRSTQSATTDFI